ncbi:universal stress protein [Micromonospora sp. KC723]|uniref:universal stress protein n=1 Tax=Micromonospora sp. KC723 TaxID=2530381 RepID=UPI00104B368C|nr:universal stress protein [Micromonospora sp. KC723]TDB76774.1 universal stress protein [Micromonospora sp. KC723]
MKIVIWVTEGTWTACVDAARDLPADHTVLLHVIDADSIEAAEGARAGLLGRGLADNTATTGTLTAAQARLLDAAEARLGRPTQREARHGRPEREVVAACTTADLLVLARDGDRGRLGPRSIGPHTRFVIDHAPCRVLLLWPEPPPGLETMPPPPHRPRRA